MEEIKDDPRFCHIVKDAKFRRLRRKHAKVKIDERFQSMFTDEKFQTKCQVDKRGRPIGVGVKVDLKRYYDLSDSEEDSENECDDKNVSSDHDYKSEKEDADKSESPLEVEDEIKKDDIKTEISDEKSKINDISCDKDIKSQKKLLTIEIKRKLRNSKIDYARGEGKFLSESSSDEEISEVEVSDNEEHCWGELDNDAETTEEATNRLAICNMDWDRIKAADLMVLFHSFLPSGGLIHSITIYPSEFGTQRMKEEEERGPSELKELVTEKEDEEMDQEQMEKLRKYQLNRLKYFYAIMVCDTKETANALYKECDGLEYECSAVKLDLRFVPDDTTFDQEPKDICTSLPDLSTYRPRLFHTTALTHSRVELTWDENDPDREALVKSIRMGKIDEDHLKQFVAYSSSDEETGSNSDNDVNASMKPETVKSSLEKYKSLLADMESNQNKKKNEVNLEVTWNLKLENKANEIVKEKVKEKSDLTPFEQYLDKRREKNKKKKLERKAKVQELQNEYDESAFSDDDIPSDIDLNDPYFREELDRTKKKKKRSKEIEEPENEKEKIEKAQLELLVLDDDRENKHFSLKKIEESEKAAGKQRKGKKRKVNPEPEDDFKIDVNDERFSALYSSHHFNIDPTDPQFRPTKATKELIEEKLRRRTMDEHTGKSREAGENGKRKNSELKTLIKNIKKNAANVKK